MDQLLLRGGHVVRGNRFRASQILIPGMVDSHRHTWEALLRGVSVDWTFAHYHEGCARTLPASTRAEDLYAANVIGMLDALDGA